MEFHISRASRKRFGVDDLLFSFSGNVLFADVAASRTLAQRMNELRAAEGPSKEIVNAGALFAMGLIDELSHAMVAQYRARIDAAVFAEGIRWMAERVEPAKLDQLLLTFVDHFPTTEVFHGLLTPDVWLAQQTDGISHREIALEELLFLWLANTNPAFAPFADLFDANELAQTTVYREVTASFAAFFATRPPFSAEDGTLLDVLRAPMLASPDSLVGQLEFIRKHWADALGEQIKRTLLAADVLREEEIAIWMRFHPPVPGRFGAGQQGWDDEGFDGDEYIGFDGVLRRRGQRYASDHQAPLNEYEAFSQDQDWMPTVVMLAKSTFVWLEQLSKKYGRHIQRLDQIPDDELQLMAARGMTALWLIGLWERSVASRTIKRLRGQADAVASAYSLKEYNIAEDLGGNTAYESLRDRAARFGIRLASDMVPNHMGIDSPWVIEHPEWFISRPVSPFPSYNFNGPDLSTDGRVEIKIEDHYFNQTDAAVVFRMRQLGSGDTRFIYHGNDGTTFAWNDTAQLDYSKAFVREHVMQTILHVARLFPIIRFDAAMVLAKRHVQRLWFPLPGQGGSIPSRAENAMTQEEFDALMPLEFWREVVDRVAVEVPGTLLLAEAFWLLEGYFVRTLGMHRVYNSAFMNMLRDEENAKYRSYLKKTIEFDPDILKRYVNFMSNPDERTTIDQFGSGDKCFGVATMLATLPGLPMFGHGQIEGFTERYGMEYKQARMDETPSEDLMARHQREIAPLLKKRHVFAESANFVLYDFWNVHGTVDENVFAYSNRSGEERALVLYNNAYASTRGTIHLSAASMDKGSGELRQRRLNEALGLSVDGALVVSYRDALRGLEYLRRVDDLDQNGFFTELRGYQNVVLQDWRELRSTAEQPWDRLCDALAGAGVYNLQEALSKLRLQPLHDALRQALRHEYVVAFDQASREALAWSRPAKLRAAGPAPATGMTPANGSRAKQAGVLPPLPESLIGFQDAAAHFFTMSGQFIASSEVELAASASQTTTGLTDGEQCRALSQAAVGVITDARHAVELWPMHLRAMLPSAQAGVQPEVVWAPLLAWVLLRSLTGESGGVQAFDTLQLRSALAEIFSSIGIAGEEAWRASARVRVLLLWSDLLRGGDLLPNRAALGITSGLPAEVLFWRDPDVRWLAGVNDASGHTYVNRELLEQLVAFFQLPTLLWSRSLERASTIEQTEQPLVATVLRAQAAGYDLGLMLDPESGAQKAPELVSAGTAPGRGANRSKASSKSVVATVVAAAEEVLAKVTSSTAKQKPAATKATAAKKASVAPKSPAATKAPAKASPATKGKSAAEGYGVKSRTEITNVAQTRNGPKDGSKGRGPNSK